MDIVLGKTAGFCYGVKRAVEGAEKEVLNNKQILKLSSVIKHLIILYTILIQLIKYLHTLSFLL